MSPANQQDGRQVHHTRQGCMAGVSTTTGLGRSYSKALIHERLPRSEKVSPG